MADPRHKTHRQIWIPRDLCDDALRAKLPDNVDPPRQYQWCVTYWLRRGLACEKKPRRPNE